MTEQTSKIPSHSETPSQWVLLRRILRFARPYWGRLVSALILTLLSASIALALPLGIKILLDDALAGGDRDLLHLLGASLFLLILVSAAASFGATVVLQTAAERMVVDIRQRLYRHYQVLDLGFFQDYRVGDLISRLDNDTDSIQQTVSSLVSSAAVNGFKLVGAVVVMVSLDLRLSLLVLVLAPVATVLSRVYGRVLRRLSRLMHERQADSTSVAQEALTAIQLVQVYGRGPHESARYAESMEAYFESAKKEVWAHAIFVSLVGLMAILSTVAIFWYGGSQVLNGTLRVGDVVAFLFYSQIVSQCIGSMAELYGGISRMIGSSERVFEIFDTEPGIRDAASTVPLREARGGLVCEGVSFAYPDGKVVLKDIDFRADPGETVALVGPSGAGKSTLLRLLPRLFDPSSGRVLLDGEDLRDLELVSLRRQMAVVSQEVQLFATTVRENVRYGRLDATDEEVEVAARMANAEGFIRNLPDGWNTEVGERGVKLSGGQRQRISIARALLREAPVLILDEATSAVDSESEALIQEALGRLRANRTTFVAAHRLSTVLNADRILVLDAGRVVGFGSHEELMATEGVYRRLVRQHFRGHTTASTSVPAKSQPIEQEAVA